VGYEHGWDNLSEENTEWSVDLLELILAGVLHQIAARLIPD